MHVIANHCLGARLSVIPKLFQNSYKTVSVWFFPYRFNVPGIRIREKLISFVFQNTCCLCNEIINEIASSDDQITCTQCRQHCFGNLLDRCYFCCAPTTLENPFGSRCRICRNWSSGFERVMAAGHYTGRTKAAILEIKRDCNDIKALQMGKLMGSICEKLDLPDTINCVVPVPSHWYRRMGRRGFHVADVMAEGFCRYTGLPKSTLLNCSRFTKKQAKLRPNARIKNVRGAFTLKARKSVQDMQILLLDDVMTTGATASECAKILLKAGASQVFVAVAARATGIS